MYKILITDDSKLARKFVRLELTKYFGEGTFQVFEASSGKEAIRTLIVEDIDFMFLDLTMPEMDGYQVLEAIRPMNFKTKTFVLSADIQSQAKEMVASLGALDFIEKPVNVDKIRTVLEKHGVMS